jgi:putative peptidoglycan lipid II flippase
LPIANLVGMLVLAPWLGEYCLPVAYLVGHVAVFLLLLRRLPYRYRPYVALRPGFERRIFANAAVVMSTGLLARSKSIVVNFLASQLGPGVITALALAAKLVEPLERGAFTGIRMLMFSHTVRLVVARDRRALGNLYSKGLCASFLVLAPLIWWIALNSEPLVEMLFLRGRFTPEMATIVAGVLLGLIPSALFLGVNQLLSNAFYAMDRVTVPAVVMPLGTVVYVAAAFPLSAALGAQGLAIATSASSLVMFVVLLLAIARQVPEIALLRTSAHLSFYAVLGGTAIVGVVAAFSSLGWSAAAVAAASLPLGTAAYCAALYLSGDRTFRSLLDVLRTYAARSPRVGDVGLSAADRSNKAPPARKTD